VDCTQQHRSSVRKRADITPGEEALPADPVTGRCALQVKSLCFIAEAVDPSLQHTPALQLVLSLPCWHEEPDMFPLCQQPQICSRDSDIWLNLTHWRSPPKRHPAKSSHRQHLPKQQHPVVRCTLQDGILKQKQNFFLVLSQVHIMEAQFLQIWITL